MIGARNSARRVEKQYGKKSLGPMSDFDWGMMNGKLSALRWVGATNGTISIPDRSTFDPEEPTAI